MSARDDLFGGLFELAEKYKIELTNSPDINPGIPQIGDFCGDVEALVLAAGYTKPRTITTVEELDGLPEGAVIRSDEGAIFEALEAWNRDESKHGIQWMETGTSWRLEAHEIALPATVLYEPTA